MTWPVRGTTHTEHTETTLKRQILTELPVQQRVARNVDNCGPSPQVPPRPAVPYNTLSHRQLNAAAVSPVRFAFGRHYSYYVRVPGQFVLFRARSPFIPV